MKFVSVDFGLYDAKITYQKSSDKIPMAYVCPVQER
jgi:hypothetical protein